MPAAPAESTATAGRDIAAAAIERMRELVGSRPLSPELRQLYREAAIELRQVLFHLNAYNDLARSAYRPAIAAVGVRRELDAIERSITSGRAS
jgi:hypothetical protein